MAKSFGSNYTKEKQPHCPHQEIMLPKTETNGDSYHSGDYGHRRDTELDYSRGQPSPTQEDDKCRPEWEHKGKMSQVIKLTMKHPPSGYENRHSGDIGKSTHVDRVMCCEATGEAQHLEIWPQRRVGNQIDCDGSADQNDPNRGEPELAPTPPFVALWARCQEPRRNRRSNKS